MLIDGNKKVGRKVLIMHKVMGKANILSAESLNSGELSQL